MVFVRENFFYRKFFIEKNADKEHTYCCNWFLKENYIIA